MRPPIHAAAWLLPVLLCVAMVALVATVRARSGERARLPQLVSTESGAFPLEIRKAGAPPQQVPAPPQRVLLANATFVDLVSELIPASRVVALPEQALTWSRLVDVDDGFRELASFRAVEPERIIAYAPDLVLCSSYNIMFGGEWAADAGIPILSMPHPQSLIELEAILERLGMVLDCETEAVALRESIRGRVRALAESAAELRGLGAIAYSNLGAGGFCAGSHTLADDMIRIAGMRNVAAELGKRETVPFTFEDIIAADPDVIVVPGRFGEQEASTYEVVIGEPSLQGVSAVRNVLVVRLHPRLFSTGSQEIVTAAEQLVAEVRSRRGGD